MPRGQFGARLVAMIDDLVGLLEREPAVPGFLLDGQTVLLEDYLRVRPEQAGTIARLVASGRIETGPWYVLADEQIPSAEALIRNLLLGKEDMHRWGGGLSVAYSPDAFGHPAVLPSIAAEFGLECGVAWRGLRSEHDLLRWRGPDGKSLVIYHLPPEGYESGSAISSDPDRVARTWRPVRDALVRRATSPHVAVFVGADHHAARIDLVELRAAIASQEPDHEVRLSRLGDFMRQAAATPGLPVRTGELREPGYTWTLQGVHGTRSHQKRRNSRLELWLERYAEPLAALSRRRNGRDRRPLLDWAWRELVQCQFHDAIGGCANDAVAREVDVRFTSVEGIAREVVRASLEDFWSLDPDAARETPEAVVPSLLLWNPVPHAREGIVLAQVSFFRRDVLVGPPGNRRPREGERAASFGLKTKDGEAIPVQVLHTVRASERLDAHRHYPDQDEVDCYRLAFEAPPIGGLEGAVFTVAPGMDIPAWGGAQAHERGLSNELVEIVVGEDGSLSVLDRATGVRREGFQLEAETDRGDTYTFAPAVPPDILRGLDSLEVRTLAGGPIVAALEITGQLRAPRRRNRKRNGAITISLLVMLFREDPVVRCSLRLNNQAVDYRLRLRFPTGNAAGWATAGTQFGSVRRPIQQDRPHVLEAPVATAPAHRYAGIGGAPGFALFAPGFFEYELAAGGDLLFTVLRSVGELSRGDLAPRPGHAGWPTPTPGAQCPGPDALDFGFSVGSANWGDPVVLHQAWEQVFLPLKAAWFRDWNGTSTSPGGIELEGAGLAFSTLKPAQSGEGVVVRCFNLTDHEVTGTLRLGFPVTRVQPVRADEMPVGDAASISPTQPVQLSAAPREIISLLIT